jgi:hypothetical protein
MGKPKVADQITIPPMPPNPLSIALSKAARHEDLDDIASHSGMTRGRLEAVFAGEDCSLTELLALCEALDYELVAIPKKALEALFPPQPPHIETMIDGLTDL